MSTIGVVTDSTNCLPAELIKEYDIRVVPYHVIVDGKDYVDQIDITPAEFWSVFGNLKELPTTSAPSPAAYLEVFTDLAKSTDKIICLIISKALSAAYKAAEIAAETIRAEHPGINIELIDSKNAAGALGFITLETARAARAGQSFAEVVKVAEDLVPKVRFFTALDTLKYLIKGGRAPKKAIVGEFLGVKPLIGLVNDTGLVQPLGKERGKRKAMLKLVDMVKDYANTDKPLHVIIHYTDNIEYGAELREMITSRYSCAEVYMTDLTPVMTTHTGPSLGLSFYS